MKTNTKKLAAATTLLLTTGALLAACSGDNQGAEPSSSSSSASANTQATAAPRGKITATIYERGDVPQEEGTKTDNRWTKWINANGPVDVTFVSIPRWESAQKLNTLFASGSAPDLIAEYDSVIKNQLYTQKQLLPLDDYINKYSKEYKAVLEQYPTLKKLSKQDDGKMYGIGKVAEVVPQHILYVRTDWLKKLNLQTPKTLDEFFAVAKAFAEQDPDGNGKKDTYGVNLSFVGGKIVDDIFGTTFDSFDKNPWILDKDGKLVFGWERMLAALDFKRKLYDAGIVDKDFLTDGKGDKAKQDFVTGKLGMWGSNGSDINAFKTLKKNDPKAEITAIPLPAGPFGTFSPLISQPIQMMSVVNAKAKDPAAVIQYIDFMYSEKASKVIGASTGNGLEGEHYKIGASGCPEPISAEKNKKELVYLGDFTMYTRGILGGPDVKCSTTNMLMNPVEPGNKTAENMADYELNKEFAAVYQSAFDAYLNPSRPMIGIVSNTYLPALPQDLQVNQTNGYKAILDILAKSNISGASYTAEQAINDAKAAWNTSNGAKVEAWIADWYGKNKENVLLTKDYYDFIKK